MYAWMGSPKGVVPKRYWINSAKILVDKGKLMYMDGRGKAHTHKVKQENTNDV
jgi:hypothetical protein